jgi:hypothetical protein
MKTLPTVNIFECNKLEDRCHRSLPFHKMPLFFETSANLNLSAWRLTVLKFNCVENGLHWNLVDSNVFKNFTTNLKKLVYTLSCFV